MTARRSQRVSRKLSKHAATCVDSTMPDTWEKSLGSHGLIEVAMTDEDWLPSGTFVAIGDHGCDIPVVQFQWLSQQERDLLQTHEELCSLFRHGTHTVHSHLPLNEDRGESVMRTRGTWRMCFTCNRTDSGAITSNATQEQNTARARHHTRAPGQTFPNRKWQYNAAEKRASLQTLSSKCW